MSNNCIFCKIIKGDIPSRKVYEDDRFVAILDVAPASKGHTIILPKNHVANIFELSEEDAKEILIVAKKVAKLLNDAFSPAGMNILQNNGEAAGQTVFHFHVHVIPRYENDTVKIGWEEHDDYDLDQVMADIEKVK